MHSAMYRLSQAMAVLGGCVLSVLVLLTFASVIGREANAVLHGDVVQGALPGLANWLIALGVGPVNGDYELIEAGIAFAIFCFLPLCQITGGHASVDIFTNHMSKPMNRLLRAMTEVIFAGVLILIAVQLFGGTMSKMRGCETFFSRTCETTFLLQFPVWWAFGLSLIGAVIAAVIGTYMGIMRVAELAAGRDLLPEAKETAH
ncbi:MAG: TRAP transporter small permease subunit [Pseudoprimorskyibacter sp.]|nr:TRAP transporter small permease subunit [Pseudoprimorskyibacter sp.]